MLSAVLFCCQNTVCFLIYRGTAFEVGVIFWQRIPVQLYIKATVTHKPNLFKFTLKKTCPPLKPEHVYQKEKNKKLFVRNSAGKLKKKLRSIDKTFLWTFYLMSLKARWFINIHMLKACTLKCGKYITAPWGFPASYLIELKDTNLWCF